jgi:glycosyltransferase involved in cell wall biosynthesis
MKVLLVPDYPGWAFDHRAKDLSALRMDTIQFASKYVSDVKKNDQYDYDLIYPMSLSIARKLNVKGIPLGRMATGVTSLRIFEKQMVNKQTFKPEFIRFVKELRGINAWSDEIVNIFKSHYRIYKTRIGINERLFKVDYSKRNRSIFTVGWVGRIDGAKNRELKGYDLVLEALKGLKVKLDIRTFKENYVTRAQMVSFYQGLDCFICSSRSEGLPNPVLEAASCGIPIITTRVGIIPELIRHKKNGMITHRTSEAIRAQVIHLMKHPKERLELGNNIAKTIRDSWTWEMCKKDWETFFRSIV